MTQDEILNHLCENTHCLFTQEFLDTVNAAFGTKIKPIRYDANRDDPKGLTLDNGEKFALGIATFDLAPLLCKALSVKYEAFIGRGYQVRACVKALREAGFGK